MGNDNSTNIDELRRRAHRQASTKLHREYELKDKAASTITMFIRRATILRRINKRLRRKSLCRGASKYAATLLRPPLVVLPPSNSQPSSTPSLHNKKRKRRQSSRRKYRRISQSKSRPRRRRPPKKFRTGNATSSTSFQANDTIQPPRTTASSSCDSTVPSTVESVHHMNKSPPAECLCLPLCFWSALTTAANITLQLGSIKSTVNPTPPEAAATIQRWYHHNYQDSSNYYKDMYIILAALPKTSRSPRHQGLRDR